MPVTVMTQGEFRHRFPSLAAIANHNWLNENRGWFETVINGREAWSHRLDEHLNILRDAVGDQVVIACYRSMLSDRNQLWQLLYEVEAAVMLGSLGTDLKLHVPRGDSTGRNFDIQVQLNDVVLSADSKTRRDDFPFRSAPDEQGLHTAARATLDPHDVAATGLNLSANADGGNYQSTPESTTIRQRLLEGLEQLPRNGLNVIVLGLIHGHPIDLEEALYGTEAIRFNGRTFAVFRFPTGAFCQGDAGEQFRNLSAVVGAQLTRSGSQIRRMTRIYPNPNALASIPEDVMEVLRRIEGQSAN